MVCLCRYVHYCRLVCTVSNFIQWVSSFPKRPGASVTFCRVVLPVLHAKKTCIFIFRTTLKQLKLKTWKWGQAQEWVGVRWSCTHADGSSAARQVGSPGSAPDGWIHTTDAVTHHCCLCLLFRCSLKSTSLLLLTAHSGPFQPYLALMIASAGNPSWLPHILSSCHYMVQTSGAARKTEKQNKTSFKKRLLWTVGLWCFMYRAENNFLMLRAQNTNLEW